MLHHRMRPRRGAPRAWENSANRVSDWRVQIPSATILESAGTSRSAFQERQTSRADKRCIRSLNPPSPCATENICHKYRMARRKPSQLSLPFAASGARGRTQAAPARSSQKSQRRHAAPSPRTLFRAPPAPRHASRLPRRLQSALASFLPNFREGARVRAGARRYARTLRSGRRARCASCTTSFSETTCT